jgi:single-stranded-DNA-specific exonuclease
MFIQTQQEKISVRDADMLAVAKLAKEINVPMAIAKVLVLRGLTSIDECKKYFKPELSHFHDPFLFRDMEKAVARIMKAIENHEKIVVYGDYDVDGITATVILLRSLRLLGGNVEYFCPNRLIEGYGMSEAGVQKTIQRGAGLIITVDCGVTAAKEVALARQAGIDVIITDHHDSKEGQLPDANAILNPKLPSSGYPEDGLAGVGIALKLCHAMALRVGKGEAFWTEYLDLAAVGTAADVVQLTGENRTIAFLGFEKLRQTKNPGLKALINAQGLSGKHLSTGEVGFQIAPCINAVGRIGDAGRGIELLLTDDEAQAQSFAQELKSANLERRAIDSNMQKEAFAWVEEHCDSQQDYAIVIGRENWHCGVVGIVASKLVEKYHRPTVLFAINPEGVARGSGRSVRGFHLHKALGQCGELLESFGGHAAAAGMTIKEANLGFFRVRFNEVAKSCLSPDDLVARVEADAQVALSDLTPRFFSLLKRMEPFGPGNWRPLFLCRALQNKYDPRIVGSNHLKMTVSAGAAKMDAVGFNLGHRLEVVKKARAFSLVFSLEENEWNGKTSLQMKVKGVEA